MFRTFLIVFSLLAVLAPAAVPVEAGTFSADSLVLRQNGSVIVTADLTTATGEIEVAHLETTDPIEVFFSDAGGPEFQPDSTLFTLDGSILNPLTATFTKLSAWQFEVTGDEEGITDLTLTLDDLTPTTVFTSPPIEVHVEEEHVEAEGLIVRNTAGDTLVTVMGATVTGELAAHPGEMSDTLCVTLLDENMMEFIPEHPDEFELVANVADTTVATIQILDPLVHPYKMIVTCAGAEAMTTTTLGVSHEGHLDYESPNIEVHCEEEHVEAEGLVLRIGATEILRVEGAVVTGQVAMPLGGWTAEIDVTFLDENLNEFVPDEPLEFPMVETLANPAMITYESLSDYSFRMHGDLAGNTTFQLGLFHEGHFDYQSPNLPAFIDATVAVNELGGATEPLRVGLPGPNPAFSTARVTYALGSSADVRVGLYDVGGRLVSLLASGTQAAGAYELTVDSRQFHPGVYFLRVQIPGEVQTRKLILGR